MEQLLAYEERLKCKIANIEAEKAQIVIQKCKTRDKLVNEDLHPVERASLNELYAALIKAEQLRDTIISQYTELMRYNRLMTKHNIRYHSHEE
jgi:hypothetical protein